MFNQQQKPAFKFVIRSKIEEGNKVNELSKNQSQTEKTESSEKESQKRKRSEKESVAPVSTKKKIYSQLERWNKKKDELKNEKEKEEELEKAKANFADLTTLACILCQRKFKSLGDLEKHQELSELHKNNLNDTAAVTRAKLKLNFAKPEPESPQVQSEYRNRAAERRQQYGQPEKPVLSPPLLPTRHAPPLREAEIISKVSMNIPIADDNLGAKMLAQMGWKKGEGLGKNKDGIINPIKAESYAQSAGIGASSKRDLSDDSYKNRTRDLARKRLFGEQS